MSKPHPLVDFAQRLAHLSQLMSNNAATAEEADHFHALLDEVLDLSAEAESEVTSTAMGILVDIGDTDSAAWLADELDIEMEMQHLPNEAGVDRACVMFALPVVTAAGESLQRWAIDQSVVGDIVLMLQEADVVDSSAQLGLVPRLFSYTELLALSYGQLRRMHRQMAHQVLSGETVVIPQAEFLADIPLDGEQTAPEVQLFFLLGVAATSNNDLPDIFPALPSEQDPEEAEAQNGIGLDDEGEMAQIELTPPGLTEDGREWEKAFCDLFDEAFGLAQGALTVLPPDGLGEDLRRGLEVARECGLLEMMEQATEGLPEDALVEAQLGALLENEEGPYLHVYCVLPNDSGQAQLLGHSVWHVLRHESEEEAVNKLLTCLEDAGLGTTDFDFPSYSQLRLN